MAQNRAKWEKKCSQAGTGAIAMEFDTLPPYNRKWGGVKMLRRILYTLMWLLLLTVMALGLEVLSRIAPLLGLGIS